VKQPEDPDFGTLGIRDLFRDEDQLVSAMDSLGDEHVGTRIDALELQLHRNSSAFDALDPDVVTRHVQRIAELEEGDCNFGTKCWTRPRDGRVPAAKWYLVEVDHQPAAPTNADVDQMEHEPRGHSQILWSRESKSLSVKISNPSPGFWSFFPRR